RILGAGTPRVVVEGVSKLSHARHRVVSDRIETGTYAMAVAITGGDVVLEGARPELLESALDLMSAAGVEIQRTNEGLRISRNGSRLLPIQVETAPFPGFPTDLQA